MEAPTENQDAFLSASSLSEITRLAIDDLEAQCVALTKPIPAMMADWIDVDAELSNQYAICSVCLGGACLVNRGWVNPLDQEILTEIHERDSDTIVSTLPNELVDRMHAIDHIRNLYLRDAVVALGARDDELENPGLLETCDDLQDMLMKTSMENRLEPAKVRETGANYLGLEHAQQYKTLSQDQLTASIRFFRKVVIPRLAKAGL